MNYTDIMKNSIHLSNVFAIIEEKRDGSNRVVYRKYTSHSDQKIPHEIYMEYNERGYVVHSIFFNNIHGTKKEVRYVRDGVTNKLMKISTKCRKEDDDWVQYEDKKIEYNFVYSDKQQTTNKKIIT